MKHIFNKISRSKSEIVTHVKCGSNAFNIVSNGNSFSGILNGYEILDIPVDKKSSEKVQFVLCNIVGDLLKSKKSSDIIFEDTKKSPVDLNSFGSESMPKDLGDIRKTLSTDFKIEDAINYRTLKSNINLFKDRVKNLTRSLVSSREDAVTLTRSRMIDSMWGAKDMKKILGAIHDEVIENESWEKAEFYENMVTKSLQRLSNKLGSKLVTAGGEEKKIVAQVLIPNVLINYDKIKKIAMDSLYIAAPLINIDKKFKEKTSYPATMFLKRSMFENLKEGYEKIKKFIIDIPKLEKAVVYPLDFMQVQLLNNK